MQQRGAPVRYRVRREWRLAKNGVAEGLTVWRDGEEDRFLTGAWAEHVEELLPSGLTHLVLFDGEKIEQMAHPDSARNVVRTGIHALLGLDIVTTLESDLVAVERKVTRVSVTEGTREKIRIAEAELEDLETQITKLWSDAATFRTELDNRLRERHVLQQQMH
jgi:DNA sulfur modification protein DndD